MENIEPGQVYTTKETRDFLKISKSTIKRYLKKGLIKANKIGGQYRIWGREILRLLSSEAETKAVDYYQKTKKRVKRKIDKW